MLDYKDDLPPFSQEEKVLEYAKENDSFSNKDIVELLQITVGSGNVLLSTMVKKRIIDTCKTRMVFSKSIIYRLER